MTAVVLPSPIAHRAVARAVVRWFAQHARPLPWRTARTPYRVWLSEVMAQQTRVGTVAPYFERFVARFADVYALAAAPLDDVLALWSGLGYYRRARQLHAAARVVVETHGGALPADPRELQKLPGVGPYIAGAIASLAFDRPAPILDGNVARVLSRLFMVAGRLGESRTERRLWRLADELLPRDNPRVFNEGLMELGALVCRPVAPRCPECPLRKFCRAFAENRLDDFPQPRRTRASQTLALLAAVVADAGGRLLLVQNPYDGLFGGLWGPPQFARPRSAVRKKDWLAEQLRARFGADFAVGKRLRTIRHELSHRRLVVEAYACAPSTALGRRAGRWIAPTADLSGLALSTFARKILQLPRSRA